MKSVVDGKPVAENEVLKTILITDRDTFRFPADAGVGTAPLGRFVIDPTKNSKQVDSTALGGPDKGKVTLGIYEIIDANNKRACWARPGEPRPTDFTSTPGSGRTLQYWQLISKDVGRIIHGAMVVGSKADLLSTDFLRAMWFVLHGEGPLWLRIAIKNNDRQGPCSVDVAFAR